MTELAETLAALEAPSLDDLGGVDVVERSGAGAACDIHADRMVAAIARTSRPTPAMSDVIIDVVEHNPYPFVVAATLVHVNTIEMPDGRDKRLQDVLLSRMKKRGTATEAEMASECLAGAFLLAVSGRLSRLAFLSSLEDVGPGDHPTYMRRAARISGLAWAWDHTPELRSVLERLADDDEVGDEAWFELGLVHLDDAIEAEDRDTLLASLDTSAEAFETALRYDRDRLEAEAICSTIRAVSLFCTDGPADEIDEHLVLAQRAFGERNLHLDDSSLRSWLRPRIDLETRWYQLALTLEGLTSNLEERSWLRAVPVLERIADTRRAMIAVASSEGDTLRRIATDRFARSFLAQEGLVAHLEAWAGDPNISDDNRVDAREMLGAVQRERDKIAGKAPRPAALPTAAGQGKLEVGTEPYDGPLLSQIGLIVEARKWFTTSKNEQVFVALEKLLNDSPDYTESVKDDVDLLLLFLIRFLSHCLDIGRHMAGETFDFLFDRSGAKPLELDLQSALVNTLRTQIIGFPQHSVVAELPDVASGRADIAIIRPNWRIVLEVKRELSDASREGLKAYLGQAASYELTGPRIGFLIVLDLCSQKDWTLTLEDNCWIEHVAGVGDSVPRQIMVIRIPGMRTVPSEIQTPSTDVPPDS